MERSARRDRGLLALGLSTLVACSTADASAFTSADRAEIEALLTDQAAAWNRGDLTAYMAGYERSPALVFTSGGVVRRGWDETYQRYQTRYGQDRGTMGTLSFVILDIRGLGADGAVVLGRWQLDDTPNAGRGVFSLALERGAEGWRVVHDHTSLTPDDE